MGLQVPFQYFFLLSSTCFFVTPRNSIFCSTTISSFVSGPGVVVMIVLAVVVNSGFCFVAGLVEVTTAGFVIAVVVAYFFAGVVVAYFFTTPVVVAAAAVVVVVAIPKHDEIDVAPVVVDFPSPVYGLFEGHFLQVTLLPPGE